ncbi:MAG TPA: hypothetical protein VK927_11805, partial [Adhaeribacter sp.]|nr:hypothetical protein [Adhaeribacter sp.]
MKLRPTQQMVGPEGIVQLELCFKNVSGNERVLLLPNTKREGLKMIYLSFYQADAHNHFTRVFTEERVYVMDRSDLSPVWYHNLDGKDSVSVPLFFRDSQNYSKYIEARHEWPRLKPGKYHIRVHYNPWNEEQAGTVYRKTSQVLKPDTLPYYTNRFNIDEGGLISNYIDVKVGEDGSLIFAPDHLPKVCEPDCRLCPAIEKGQWKLVRELINKSSAKPFAFQGANFPYPRHRNVAYLYPGPDVILSSLPSSYSRKVIFKNPGGYHYYQIGWQVGKIYPFRSRLNYL